MRRLIGLVASLGATGACATITGLSQFSKEDCAESPCTGGADSGSNEGIDSADAIAGDDLADPCANGKCAGRSDSGYADAYAASDVASDITGDARARGDAGSGAETGCGAANTVENCGACGRACDSRTGTPSCRAGACSYNCSAGRSDCNVSLQPDTDGCECATPACCSGGACQTTHSNGAGQSFYDCVSTGTYNAAQAQEACAAHPGGGPCTALGLACGSLAWELICTQGASDCYCWEFMGPNPGTVQINANNNVCACSTGPGLPTWN
jgi:hypothetical protein